MKICPLLKEECKKKGCEWFYKGRCAMIWMADDASYVEEEVDLDADPN